MGKDLKNRYEFVVFFDVENGNPNGDPDAGNMPRVDAETSVGIVTDVCLKRKIRNYVELVKEGESGYNILVKPDRALNTKFTEAFKECDLNVNEKIDKETEDKDKNNKSTRKDKKIARDYICQNYYDVRTFGAVMTTGGNPCGIVRGPIQINFAQSIDPVLPQEITITRQAITKRKEFEDDQKENEMGKKNFIAYGLYRAEGYISAMLANKTGFSEDDLEVTFEAIINMFEHDHSAARGKMCVRRLIVFKHTNILGNAPSHTLFEKIEVTRKSDVEVARKFTDYEISIDKNMPEGVTLIEKL